MVLLHINCLYCYISTPAMWELDYLEQCGNNSEDFQMVRDVLKLMFLVRRETTITMSKRNYNITRDLIVDLKGFNFNFFTYR